MGGGGYRGYTSKDVYKPAQGNYKKPTSKDKKIAPPLTVDRSGKITRRGQDSAGTGGGLFRRNPDTSGDRGTIKRGESGGGCSIRLRNRTRSRRPESDLARSREGDEGKARSL